jgi:Methyltransferase domain
MKTPTNSSIDVHSRSFAASRVFTSLSTHFRRRRMARFARELEITAGTRVLDIGGTPDCWRLLPAVPRVTLLNTPRAGADLAGAESWVAGDGRALPFPDGAFDVVFSNSVIEHVGDAASQRRFAREVSRVGRAYWVQTPNRRFPLEQHLLTPLIHWLPKRWQRVLVPRYTVWGAVARVSPDQRRYFVQHYLTDLRLLSGAELRALFPDCGLIRERFCGWTKSLVAIRKMP